MSQRDTMRGSELSSFSDAKEAVGSRKGKEAVDVFGRSSGKYRSRTRLKRLEENRKRIYDILKMVMHTLGGKKEKRRNT